jgi:8-oxo-dGTP pyrophosphatase MutT (NUDIX family)
MDQAVSLHRADRLELAFEPKPWAFALERQAEIAATFAALQRAKPALYNGRVLLLHRHALEDGVLRGAFLETDYASFSAWIKWRWPDRGMHDCYGAAAMLSADGAFLLGEMGPHTFNTGQIYFPCGTPGPEDIADGKVDLDFSLRRELAEETGLAAADFIAEPGWTIAVDGAQIVAIKVLRSPLDAETLRGRICGWLQRQRQPELSDIRIVRGPADFHPNMRRFITAFLARRFGGG